MSSSLRAPRWRLIHATKSRGIRAWIRAFGGIEWRTICGVDDDRFEEMLADVGADGLTDLAQRYSYVFPDDRSLAALAALGPLVEVGAGTGYWASRLRERSVDVVAIDEAPPDGERTNRYHRRTATWTEVITDDHTILTRYSDRALFLCWPPLFSTLGECLTYYSGSVVALVGDGGHRTARLTGLSEAFTRTEMLPVRALEPMPEAAATLTIWCRTAR
jgi:hypothetical protein